MVKATSEGTDASPELVRHGFKHCHQDRRELEIPAVSGVNGIGEAQLVGRHRSIGGRSGAATVSSSPRVPRGIVRNLPGLGTDGAVGTCQPQCRRCTLPTSNTPAERWALPSPDDTIRSALQGR